MLRINRSLAGRAALIFVSIYIVVCLTGLVLLAFVTVTSDEARHYAGPRVALTFVEDELLFQNGQLILPTQGAFGQFAARNPKLWVLAERGARRYAYGPVPAAASEAM